MASSKMDPLLRGIYSLYLNYWAFIIYYKDPEAHAELISIAQLLNMDTDWGSMTRYRHAFVKELVKRYGH